MAERLQSCFWIFLGGGLGSLARYGVSGLAGWLWSQTFPWGTLIANVTGSFVIGFFFTLTDTDGRLLVSPTMREFVMIGICGGYTTFSSFSLQTLKLVREGQWLYAGGNVMLSVALCLFAVWLGHVLAAALTPPRGG